MERNKKQLTMSLEKGGKGGDWLVKDNLTVQANE